MSSHAAAAPWAVFSLLLNLSSVDGTSRAIFVGGPRFSA
jgi:hypothetical protein